MSFLKKPGAVYLQIADHICEQVLSGAWKEKSPIPPARELSVALEVNPNAVIKAYDWLQQEKIIESDGQGYLVSRSAIDKLEDLKREYFLKEELPLLFERMDMLHVKMKEVEACYKAYKKITL